MTDKIIQIVVEKNTTSMMYAAGGDAGELTHKALIEEFGEGRLFVSNIHPVLTEPVSVENLKKDLMGAFFGAEKKGDWGYDVVETMVDHLNSKGMLNDMVEVHRGQLKEEVLPLYGSDGCGLLNWLHERGIKLMKEKT